MKFSDTLRAQADGLRAEKATLIAEADDLTVDETRDVAAVNARADEIIARCAEIDTEAAALDKRADELDKLDAARDASPKGPSFLKSTPQPDLADVRALSVSEARDTALRITEEARWVSPSQKAAVERLVSKRTENSDGDLIARRLIATERPEYRSAFFKGLTGRADELSEPERRALSEVRAMSLTTTAGGFGVPVLIDPTVLITDGTGLLGILPYCSVETITTNIWKGVSAGHTAWSFDAEGAEVSDDTSTFAQPSITAHMARGYIPFSIEIEQDYPGFASEMSALLADGYMDLLAEKLMVGTGSSEPWGIFITTTTTVDVTTDNTFGAPDIDKVWAALGERFRSRATWCMNVDVENDIRGFGSGTATSRFTVDQTAEGISRLNGRPVVLSDWAPTWAGTDAAKILVVGDFSRFKVVQRAGMTVELMPHVTSTGNGRPTGQRGWFAWARVGSDKTVQNAFRVLKNITT